MHVLHCVKKKLLYHQLNIIISTKHRKIALAYAFSYFFLNFFSYTFLDFILFHNSNTDW